MTGSGIDLVRVVPKFREAAPKNSGDGGTTVPSTRFGPYVQLGTGYAVFAIFVTFLTLSISGSYSIALIYPLWFVHLIRSGRSTLRVSPAMLAAFALPAWALLSTVWSVHPDLSLRTGLELISLVACGVIAARIVKAEDLILGLILSTGVVCILTIASGRYAVDGLTGQSSLIGYSGSKNNVAFYGSLGIIFSFIGILRLRKTIINVILSLVCLTTSLLALKLSHSAGSIVSLAFVFVVVGGVLTIVKLPKFLRLRILPALALLLVLASLVGWGMGAQESVLRLLGKNATLTGRTDLWAEGVTIGREAPLRGHGFEAFWVRGDQRAEGLWYHFKIADRTGFHFHSMYVETFVELGLVGTCILVLIILIFFTRSLVCAVRYDADAESLICLCIASILLIRSFIELDFLWPYIIGEFLFYPLLVRLNERRLPFQVPVETTGQPKAAPLELLNARSYAAENP